MPSSGEQMRSEPTEMRRPQLTDHMRLPPTVEFTGFQKPVIAFPQQSQNVFIERPQWAALSPSSRQVQNGFRPSLSLFANSAHGPGAATWDASTRPSPLHQSMHALASLWGHGARVTGLRGT